MTRSTRSRFRARPPARSQRDRAFGSRRREAADTAEGRRLVARGGCIAIEGRRRRGPASASPPTAPAVARHAAARRARGPCAVAPRATSRGRARRGDPGHHLDGQRDPRAAGCRAGDDGIIATRGWDVLTSHTPNVGQYSEAGLVVHGQVMHSPGPMLYWLIALPARFGSVTSVAATMGVVNTLAIIGGVRARSPPRRAPADVRRGDRDRADVPVAADRVLPRHLEPGRRAVSVSAADLHRLVARLRRVPAAPARGPRSELRDADASDVRRADRGRARGGSRRACARRARTAPPCAPRPSPEHAARRSSLAMGPRGRGRGRRLLDAAGHRRDREQPRQPHDDRQHRRAPRAPRSARPSAGTRSSTRSGSRPWWLHVPRKRVGSQVRRRRAGPPRADRRVASERRDGRLGDRGPRCAWGHRADRDVHVAWDLPRRR